MFETNPDQLELLPAEAPDPRYSAPGRVHRKARDTERAAADRSRLTASADRERVLRFLGHSEDGLTDEQLVHLTRGRANTIPRRRCDLKDKGLVRDSGRRRKTSTGTPAIVWELTDDGHEAFRSLEREAS